jgi:Putative zinc-finger
VPGPGCVSFWRPCRIKIGVISATFRSEPDKSRYRRPRAGRPASAVMRCEEARQLFDAYLDGELSPSLATELGVHRVRCAECRRSFALLEVSGHIISSDRDPVTVPDDFSERLLACVDVREHGWVAKVRRTLYFVGPLAAAAVIAMAFLGFFDRGRDSRVASMKVEPTHVEAGTPRPNAPSAYDREGRCRRIGPTKLRPANPPPSRPT